MITITEFFSVQNITIRHDGVRLIQKNQGIQNRHVFKDPATPAVPLRGLGEDPPLKGW